LRNQNKPSAYRPKAACEAAFLLGRLAKPAGTLCIESMKVTTVLLLLLSLGLSGCIIVIEQAKEKKDAPAAAAKSEAK